MRLTAVVIVLLLSPFVLSVQAAKKSKDSKDAAPSDYTWNSFVGQISEVARAFKANPLLGAVSLFSKIGDWTEYFKTFIRYMNDKIPQEVRQKWVSNNK